MATFSIVVAADEERGIGRAGRLPWHIPADLKRFKEITNGGALLMGMRTWESMGDLPGRLCITIGSKGDFHSLAAALSSNRAGARPIFVIGGARLYAAALEHPGCERIYYTEIKGTHGADVFMPSIDESVYEVSCGEWQQSGGETFRFCEWRRRPEHPEMQYVNLVRRILAEPLRPNRTDMAAYSAFGAHLRFDLRRGFPLLTTKKVWFRGVAEELLWFIRGQTNARILAAKGVHIWDANTSEKTLRGLGLNYPEGEAGPIYGYQWRNWGGDQLREALRLLKEDPYSRRIIISAWNVADIPKMALPPCHVLMQFYCKDGLCCQVYQRSADVGLGLPFNIASYALMTHIMGALSGLPPREVLFAIGDCHIYKDHADPLREQIGRKLYPFPQLEMPELTWKSLSTVKAEDFHIRNYKHGAAVRMEMPV